MPLEVAVLQVKEEQTLAFEKAMKDAVLIVASMPGFQSADVRPNLDVEGQYLLTISWRKRTDHTEGFRKSPEYQKWKALLHHFYEPMPTVEYFGPSIFDT